MYSVVKPRVFLSHLTLNYAFKEKPSFDIELCMQGKHSVHRCHRAANPGSLNLDGCELMIDVKVRGQSWIENKGEFANYY